MHGITLETIVSRSLIREGAPMPKADPPKCPTCKAPMRPAAGAHDDKNRPSGAPRQWRCEDCGTKTLK